MRFPTRKPWLWHRWFAWYPVPVGTEWVWWQEVWRREGCDWGDCEWLYSIDEPKE